MRYVWGEVVMTDQFYCEKCGEVDRAEKVTCKHCNSNDAVRYYRAVEAFDLMVSSSFLYSIFALIGFASGIYLTGYVGLDKIYKAAFSLSLEFLCVMFLLALITAFALIVSQEFAIVIIRFFKRKREAREAFKAEFVRAVREEAKRTKHPQRMKPSHKLFQVSKFER